MFTDNNSNNQLENFDPEMNCANVEFFNILELYSSLKIITKELGFSLGKSDCSHDFIGRKYFGRNWMPNGATVELHSINTA